MEGTPEPSGETVVEDEAKSSILNSGKAVVEDKAKSSILNSGEIVVEDEAKSVPVTPGIWNQDLTVTEIAKKLDDKQQIPPPEMRRCKIMKPRYVKKNFK